MNVGADNSRIQVPQIILFQFHIHSARKHVTKKIIIKYNGKRKKLEINSSSIIFLDLDPTAI